MLVLTDSFELILVDLKRGVTTHTHTRARALIYFLMNMTSKLLTDQNKTTSSHTKCYFALLNRRATGPFSRLAFCASNGFSLLGGPTELDRPDPLS